MMKYSYEEERLDPVDIISKWEKRAFKECPRHVDHRRKKRYLIEESNQSRWSHHTLEKSWISWCIYIKGKKKRNQAKVYADSYYEICSLLRSLIRWKSQTPSNTTSAFVTAEACATFFHRWKQFTLEKQTQQRCNTSIAEECHIFTLLRGSYRRWRDYTREHLQVQYAVYFHQKHTLTEAWQQWQHILHERQNLQQAITHHHVHMLQHQFHHWIQYQVRSCQWTKARKKFRDTLWQKNFCQWKYWTHLKSRLKQFKHQQDHNIRCRVFREWKQWFHWSARIRPKVHRVYRVYLIGQIWNEWQVIVYHADQRRQATAVFRTRRFHQALSIWRRRSKSRAYFRQVLRFFRQRQEQTLKQQSWRLWQAQCRLTRFGIQLQEQHDLQLLSRLWLEWVHRSICVQLALTCRQRHVWRHWVLHQTLRGIQRVDRARNHHALRLVCRSFWSWQDWNAQVEKQDKLLCGKLRRALSHWILYVLGHVKQRKAGKSLALTFHELKLKRQYWARFQRQVRHRQRDQVLQRHIRLRKQQSIWTQWQHSLLAAQRHQQQQRRMVRRCWNHWTRHRQEWNCMSAYIQQKKKNMQKKNPRTYHVLQSSCSWAQDVIRLRYWMRWQQRSRDTRACKSRSFRVWKRVYLHHYELTLSSRILRSSTLVRKHWKKHDDIRS